MGATLGWNRYGKSMVRVMKVRREGAVHHVRELTVAIGLEGEFTTAHTEGDNSGVLPTDTMKNTVYAKAKGDPIASIESFALVLGRHFVSTVPHVARARVEIVETQWHRIEAAGRAHPHTFQRIGPETPMCEVVVERAGARVVSGIRSMVILKTAQSGFSGFLRDGLTTLRETDDRLFGTSVTAMWPVGASADFSAVRSAVRGALVDTFAAHDSLSVQQTLYAMGEAALAAAPGVGEITVTMPNKHCLLVDLAPFGMENANEVFLPIDEPHGLIEATIRRA
jgi:urate oxidase